VLSDEGAVRRVLVTLTDISEMRFLQSEVEQLSIRDPLTGVFNQPHILHLLENEIHRARRYGTPFTLAQIDIDRFRAFCTEHGQATGDSVLQRMGSLLCESMREIDIAGRIGIDDFLLILPNIALKDAMVGLERLRGLIETLTFTDKFLRVTVSGGMAEYSGENAEAMIERCQSLVMQARESGRNRFCMDTDIL
jgi:diguanylate cyclase (GGDEF)-like protein